MIPRRRSPRRALWAAVGAGLLLGGAPAAAGADTLQAGVGRADITPPTGYYFMGWVRSDGVGRGVHTRLYARAIVLKLGARKLALVSEDLNGIPGGVLKAAADADHDVGFSEQNVLDSASHTHAGPSQFYNFPSYDTVFMTDSTPTQQNVSGTLDPQLYAFEVHQLALAIRHADDDLGPAHLGWGATRLTGLTQNRSLEAHLANYGIIEPFGTGTPSQDPGGPDHTIDPAVDVLRVDKLLTVPSRPAAKRRPCARRPRRRRASKRGKTKSGASCPRKRKPKRKRTKHGKARPARARRHRARRRPARRPSKPAPATTSRYVPVAMWSQFADHGTVNKYTFGYYNADHHGAAIRVTEAALRRAGGAPATQDVVNAYGNSDEGDMTAGIAHSGPADADWVGRQEANAMLAAWREAGTSMTDHPQLDERWTRTCFCGQLVTGGAVDSQPVFGVPQLTGSEEGRGPLYDNTHVPFEGVTSPTEDPVQGDKVASARPPALNVPRAVPMMVLRVGDRLVVSIPGEMTVGMGERVRAAVRSASGSGGISRVVIAGLANEYLSYYTTPEEYERQHYEGGSTLYGRYSSNLLAETLVELTRRLGAGTPAPDPYPYDPTDGVSASAPPFDTGPSSASASTQPTATPRLGHAEFGWTGGPRGLDRPVDSAFVTIRRKVGDGWQTASDDLGLQIVWSVDDSGSYRARWEVPVDAPAGTYEFLVTANHYRLESAPFTVGPSSALSVARAGAPAGGGLTVTLDYPTAVYEQDYTYRPRSASGGRLQATVNGRPVTVSGRDGAFLVPVAPGDSVSVAAGGARDDFGNTNATPFSATG
ncbi:MAG: hypothetical protein E6G56_02980 [Actinobacteria bacterium]|nr:MAG: hypothetical protein E6G56_02980 [Actinomycetota bacterium]